MNNLRNKVLLIGRLGNDPEVKQLESGKMYAAFSLATSEKYRNKDGKTEESTQWHRIKAFGSTAELASKYLKKGEEVALEGKLNYWFSEDKTNGKRYFADIIINEILFLGGSGPNPKAA